MVYKRPGKIIFSQDQINTNGLNLRLNVIQHSISDLCYEYRILNVSQCYKEKACLILLLLTITWNIFYVVLSYKVSALLHIFCIISILNILWKVDSESLLVVASVGLQQTTKYKCGYQMSLFIPWQSIKDVVINEAISLHRVIFYLVVLVEKESQLSYSKQNLVPLFQLTSPRLLFLEVIYRGVQKVLEA